MPRKLQNEDFKTEADLTGAGGSASQLLNDTKIYVTANSINKTLDDAIIDGDLGGATPLNILSKSADYTILDGDVTDGGLLVLVTTANTDRTITLPTLSANIGKQITIRKIDSGTGYVIIDGESTELIDSTQTKYLLQKNEDMVLVGTSPEWAIVAEQTKTFLESAIATGTNWGASGQYYDVTSLSIPPGDWELWGSQQIDSGSATISGVNIEFGITTTSGNSGTGMTYGQTAVRSTETLTGRLWSQHTPRLRVSVTSTTTYYLKGRIGSYSGGTPTNGASLRARRLKA